MIYEFEVEKGSYLVTVILSGDRFSKTNDHNIQVHIYNVHNDVTNSWLKEADDYPEKALEQANSFISTFSFVKSITSITSFLKKDRSWTQIN